MPGPDFNWIADPDIITSAIQLLAGAVAGTGALLVAVLAWIWNKTDAKIDRIANSLETLTLTTSVDLATIKAKCRANHPE